jgi:hypothetical protein
MARRARILTWNGKDVPAELRDLPAGRYLVEAVDEEVPALSLLFSSKPCSFSNSEAAGRRVRY